MSELIPSTFNIDGNVTVRLEKDSLVLLAVVIVIIIIIALLAQRFVSKM